VRSKFDTIIIGGGLGGLTAGSTLAKFGKKVLLLEQHYIPGGCATTFKRRDYVMEVGLHELDGLYENDSKQEIFKFLEVDKNINFVTAPELFRYKSKDTDIVHPHGAKEVVEALIAKYPDDQKGIRKYVDTMDAILTEIPKFPTERWKQILLYPILPFLYPNTVRASKKNLGDWLDEHISNNELKLILQGNLVYYHDDPYTMSMIYFSVAQSSYIGGGGHFIQGGSQHLSNYLANLIEDNGGQVLLGKKATKIIVESGNATGVSFKDSFNDNLSEVSVYSDRIIANAAIPLVVDLLPEAESKKLASKVQKFETACSLISVYIGFRKEPKQLGNRHYSTILVGDDVQSMADINANCHADWENRNFIFVDYSQVDARLAPEGKAFGTLCAADYLADWENLDEDAYTEKKERVARILIERLEKLIPGISAEIEHYEVGTPKTIQSYLLTPEGTPYGFAQTPKQSGMGRIPTKSPIKNLYFAGTWTFPGGGFTGAIISGFLCGNQVNKTLAKTIAAEPKRLEDQRITQIIEKRKIAKDTIEIVIERPEGFSYTAGQYAILDLINPVFQELDMPIRSLSLASHPDEAVLKFAMRLSDSSYKKSIDTLKEGDRCRVFGPMGDFAVATRDRGIVFLVSGIGITPILPLLKEVEKNPPPHSVYLFYSNRTEDAAAYHAELQSIAIPTYEYVPVFTGTQERINAQFLESKLKSLQAFDYYVIGHHEFLQSMRSLLLDNNVDKKQIIVDDFG
jgi:all-trans-retinol 13,14-reductase